VLTSNGIKKRADVVIEKRLKMRQRYENKITNQAGISDAETREETAAETPQSKVKKSKVKKSKEDIYISAKPANRFVPPTLEEVKAYCLERNNSVDPERFIDHYTANGWVQSSGQKIKDWRATVRTWEKRDKQKSAQSSSNPFFDILKREGKM
jgi:hypothetical protein